MRKPMRIAILAVILLAVLAPAAWADGPCWGEGCFDGHFEGGCGTGVSNPCVGTSTTGPCPDDPALSAKCDQQTPPYYVVINRNVTCTNRTGTGCAPFILKHPECKDCNSRECVAINVEEELCKPELAGKVPAGQTEVLYEMCCAGQAGDSWQFRVRLLNSDGACPLDPDNQTWIQGLPPGTGVKLTTPVMIGGLTALGAGFLAVGLVIRRRKK